MELGLQLFLEKIYLNNFSINYFDKILKFNNE
jgi:hypothetical protein